MSTAPKLSDAELSAQSGSLKKVDAPQASAATSLLLDPTELHLKGLQKGHSKLKSVDQPKENLDAIKQAYLEEKAAAGK